jgi:hypothetical protein
MYQFAGRVLLPPGRQNNPWMPASGDQGGAVSANKYTLKHHNVEVEYDVDITPGIPALTYTDSSGQRSFRDGQITTDVSALGSLVSVALRESIDTGRERFGFYLRDVDVTNGAAEFHTIGVYETFGGPDSVPRRPASYRCIEMYGTAQNVIHR